MKTSLIPALGADALLPFIPVLMGHTAAALTSLGAVIREEALLLLDILMEWRADIVVSQYLVQVVQHFVDALGRPTRGRSLKAGSVGSLCQVLTGLRNFLIKGQTHLLLETIKNAGDVGMDVGVGERRVVCVRSDRCRWQDAPSAQMEMSSANDVQDGTIQDLVVRLIQVLVDCWIECGPSEFCTAPDGIAVQAATTAMQCCNILVQFLSLRGTDAHALYKEINTTSSGTIEITIAVYFPFTEPVMMSTGGGGTSQDTPRDKKIVIVRDQLMQLNVATAQFLLGFLPVVLNEDEFVGGERWPGRVLSWLKGVMAQGVVLPKSRSTHIDDSEGDNDDNDNNNNNKNKTKKKTHRDQPSSAIVASSLTALLSMLPLLPYQQRRTMLTAAWTLFQNCPIKSSVRSKILTTLLCPLLSQSGPVHRYTPCTDGMPLVEEQEVLTWISAMPRFIYELISSSLKTTKSTADTAMGSTTSHAQVQATVESALMLMLDGIRLAPSNSYIYQTLAQDSTNNNIQLQFAPLFGILMKNNLPSNASSKKSGSRPVAGKEAFVPGPLALMPVSVQQLAVDVLFHLPSLPECTLNVVSLLGLGAGAYPVHTTTLKLIDTLTVKSSHADPVQYWRCVVTLVSGTSRSGVEVQGKERQNGRGWERREAVVAAALRAAVVAAGSAVLAVETLGPPLLEIYNSLDIHNNKGTRTSTSIGMEETGTARNMAVSKVTVLHGLLHTCLLPSPSLSFTAPAFKLPFEYCIDFVQASLECANTRAHGEAQASPSPSPVLSPQEAVATVYRYCTRCRSKVCSSNVDISLREQEQQEEEEGEFMHEALTALLTRIQQNKEKATFVGTNEKYTTLQACLMILLSIASSEVLEAALVRGAGERGKTAEKQTKNNKMEALMVDATTSLHSIVVDCSFTSLQPEVQKLATLVCHIFGETNFILLV